MSPDTRVVTTHGTLAVLADPYAIILRDGSMVLLHGVLRAGVPDRLLRAIAYQSVHWCVFNLRQLLPRIDEDFAALPHRDHAGVVLFGLRDAFPTDAELVAAAFKRHADVWTERGAEPLIVEGSGIVAPTRALDLRSAA